MTFLLHVSVSTWPLSEMLYTKQYRYSKFILQNHKVHHSRISISLFHCVCTFIMLVISSPVALRPNAGQSLLIHEVSRSHTATHHNRYDSSGWVICSSQRPLPDNTQHSQQTDTYASGGIRTRNPGKRAAADPCIRPRGHRDLRCYILL